MSASVCAPVFAAQAYKLPVSNAAPASMKNFRMELSFGIAAALGGSTARVFWWLDRKRNAEQSVPFALNCVARPRRKSPFLTQSGNWEHRRAIGSRLRRQLNVTDWDAASCRWREATNRWVASYRSTNRMNVRYWRKVDIAATYYPLLLCRTDPRGYMKKERTSLRCAPLYRANVA